MCGDRRRGRLGAIRWLCRPGVGELRGDLVDSRCLVWLDAFKSGLDLLGREVTREVEVSAGGTSEVSHHRGGVSGESLSRIGESPIADELSGDAICCYGAHR